MDRGNRTQEPPAVALHLVPEDAWRAQRAGPHFVPEGFSGEGFIHCTHGEDVVIEVGNRYYQDDPRPYLALELDLERVAAPVIYEDDHRRYPHIYGPLERQAVRTIYRVERSPDGAFVSVGRPAPEHLG